MTYEEKSQPLVVSIDEAARRAGIARGTVYAQIAGGRLRARKIGRRTVIAFEDLVSWLNSLPILGLANTESANG